MFLMAWHISHDMCLCETTVKRSRYDRNLVPGKETTGGMSKYTVWLQRSARTPTIQDAQWMHADAACGKYEDIIRYLPGLSGKTKERATSHPPSSPAGDDDYRILYSSNTVLYFHCYCRQLRRPVISGARSYP